MLLNKYTNWKKIGLLAIDALLIFNMVFSTCNLAQAYDSKSFGVEGGSFSIPEPISVIDDVLKKLNVDPGSIANMSQQLNVSEQKIPFPEVSIFFNPSDPKSGQKITAEASPMYFSTPEEKLYFTWYIKHADGSSDDVNDWKIEAMKIIGQNGYDKNDDPKPDYNNDNDSDGYFAPLGGGDKVRNERGDEPESTPAYCFVTDFSSGESYKIGQVSETLTKPKYEAICPTGSTAVCLNTVSNTCKSAGTPTCTNSKIECVTGEPRCVDDGIINSSSLYSGGTFKYNRTNGLSIVDSYGVETDNPAVNPHNQGGVNPPSVNCTVIVEAALRYDDAPCFSSVANADECFYTVSETDGDITYDDYVNPLTSSTTSCEATNYVLNYQRITGWQNFMSGNELSGLGCSTHAKDYTITTPTSCTVTGQEDKHAQGCEHLFADTKDKGKDFKLGDGKFGGEEEEFWGTNPQDPNTSGKGNLDEAILSGLGQDTFTWTYQTGDKVGVIVEGTSMTPTKYEDGSYMTMWALPKNIFFGKTNKPDSGRIVPETGYAKGFDFSVLTYSKNPIDDSLEYNLIDPAEKTSERLEVSLSAIPDNPMNDPSGDEMGDVLSVNSIVGNTTQNFSQLSYDWKIFIGKESVGNFSNISDDLVGDNLVDGNLSGINNSKINVRLNLGENYKEYFDNSGIGYLKIINTVKETSKKYGKEEVIIKINSTGKKIKAYLTTSEDGNELAVSKEGLTDNVICNNKENSTSDEKLAEKLALYICPVVKNQVLKLIVDKDGMTFAWKVNGSSYTCDSNIFGPDCDGGNIIFIPIIGNVGDSISVTVSGKDMNVDNGKNIELTKSFQIVNPYVKIISGNEGNEGIFWPKMLGSYSDLDGKQYSDYSDSLFETYNGVENVSLEAEFHPVWLPKIGVISAEWTMDEEKVTDPKYPQKINFNVTKSVGESYNIEFKSFYSSSNNVRKVLNKYWGISQNESEGEILAASVRGEVIDEDIPDGTTGMLNKSGKFLASIASNFPSQAIFLLRMALVIFVVIFLSGIAFNLSPEFLKNKK